MLDVSIAPAPAPDAPFEDHVEWARNAPATPATPAALFTGGLDATPVVDRLTTDAPEWDYPALAREIVLKARGTVLDIGTGDGDFFAGLGSSASPADRAVSERFLFSRSSSVSIAL